MMLVLIVVLILVLLSKAFLFYVDDSAVRLFKTSDQIE